MLFLAKAAIQTVAESIGAPLGLHDTGKVAGDVTNWLVNHFSDPSKKLPKALNDSIDKSWQVLEMALEGETFWQRVTASGQLKGFAEQVRHFIDETKRQGICDPMLNKKALAELRDARKNGHLAVSSGDINQLQGDGFIKFEAPEKIAKFDEDMVNQLTNKLKVMGYENLCAIAGAKPTGQKPIILIAVRYYFRCRLEQDPALTNGLNSNRLVTIDVQQEKALAGIDQLMTQGEELKKLLTETNAVVMETLSVAVESRDNIKALEIKFDRAQAENSRYLAAILERIGIANRPMRIGDGASMSRGSKETTEALGILKQFETIKAGNNCNSQIVSTAAKVYSSIGNYDEAVKNFRDAATLETDSAKKAEQHYNAYMTLLEKKDFDQAIRELVQAVNLDRKRFEPIPVVKYIPKKILGAGGFGVVFLCEHREMKSKLAVKSLMLEKLGGDPDRVLDEARIVGQLDSPSIIKIYDCGFMEQKSKERPYIVMEFFNGTDLFDVIEKQGALPLDDALHIMHQAAKGLQAAHANGVLHRDVKPHNLLVRKENPNENGPQWAVKLIDFGLAMQQKVSDVSTVAQLKTGSTMSGNLVDNSIAGTMEYAAPEQMGRRPEKVGKYSDAFGWAKMCCYTLFKTTQPLRTHWKNIPEDIADLLERCLTEDPKQRPKDFSEIIDVLVNYRKESQDNTEKSNVASIKAEDPKKTKDSHVPSIPDKTIDASYAEYVDDVRLFTDQDKLNAPLPSHPDNLTSECQRLGNLRYINPTGWWSPTKELQKSASKRLATCLATLEMWAFHYPEYRSQFIQVWNTTAAVFDNANINQSYFASKHVIAKYTIANSSPMDQSPVPSATSSIPIIKSVTAGKTQKESIAGNSRNSLNDSGSDYQNPNDITLENFKSLLDCAIRSISFTSYKLFGNPDYSKVAKEPNGSFAFPCDSGSDKSKELFIVDEIISQFNMNPRFNSIPDIKKTISKISRMCGNQSTNNLNAFGLRILFVFSIYPFCLPGFVFWGMLSCMINRFKLRTKLLEILDDHAD